MDRISSRTVAAAVEAGSDADLDVVLARLRSDRAAAARVLTELATHRSPEVRSWVPWAARRVMGTEAVQLISKIASEDRRADVRHAATVELLELDQAAAQTLAPVLRRRLQSKNPFEALGAMWALARIGDKQSVGAVRELVTDSDRQLLRRSAAVVLMILEGSGEEILARIRAHDHELMPWLPEAARLVAGGGALPTIEECARTAPDDDCRSYCEQALQRSRV